MGCKARQIDWQAHLLLETQIMNLDIVGSFVVQQCDLLVVFLDRKGQ